MQTALNITFLAITATSGAVVQNMIHKYQHAQALGLSEIVEILAKPTGLLAVLVVIGIYFYKKNEKKEVEINKLREEKENILKAQADDQADKIKELENKLDKK